MTNTTSTHRWPHDLAYLWGGVFLANVIPHFVAGISGSPFQSPFANPPGVGLSSSTLNVVWGLINLAIAYLLLVRVGRFELRSWRCVLVFTVGFAAMAFFLAGRFGQLHGGAL